MNVINRRRNRRGPQTSRFIEIITLVALVFGVR
jgi:hypothetical protein